MLLKKILLSKGIKQNWLSEKMGVSEVTVSNWCKGKAFPNTKHLNKISKILGVSVEQLTNK